MNTKTSGMGYDFCAFLNYDFSNDFTVYEVGSYQCPPRYSYGPSARSHNILHYVVHGEGRLILNHNEYNVKENQIFLIPAEVNAFYEADETNPWCYRWLHLNGPLLNDILKIAGLNENSPVFTSTGDVTILNNIFSELLKTHDKKYYCMAKVYELADYLVTYSINKHEDKANLQLEYVRKIIQFIQLKYALPIQVTDIASALGLNRSYLTRLFKDATGSSIQSYLFSYRMKAAQNLLKNPEYSIHHIASSVGYTDVFTFSKAFKRYSGASPKEYRLNIHNID